VDQELDDAITVITRTYIEQVMTYLREMEEVVMAKHVHALRLVLERPSLAFMRAGLSGDKNRFMYHPVYPVKIITSDDVKEKTIEAYIVWKAGISEWVRKFMDGHSRNGKGDAEMNKELLMSAVMLVRSRVMSHPDWFPNVKRRRIGTLVRHEALFKKEDTSFAALRTLDDLLRRECQGDPVRTDYFFTAALVERAIENDLPKEEAYAFIAT